jgi:tRNA(adenine34) deaminase
MGLEPEHLMRETLNRAAEAMRLGEFPIAALVVLDGEIIGHGNASEQREGRYLGHAEMVALEMADRLRLSMEERRRAILYTNLEPCLMCVGAAMSFFLGKICYGLESPGDGALDLVKTWIRREEDFPAYQMPLINGGLLREESIRLFERYLLLHPEGSMRDWAETLARL